MSTESSSELGWSPNPAFPSSPEFYRRVLDHLPSPVIVVNDQGAVVYGNHALLALGGWELSTHTGTNVLAYVHPDDRTELAAAFIDLAASPGARVLQPARPWAEIYFRIVAVDGTIIPVELVGTGGVTDPVVGGIIYEVRPARFRNLLGRLLDGLTQGAPLYQLLALVVEMITSPPLDLGAAILELLPDGSLRVAASSVPELTDQIVNRDCQTVPWSAEPTSPMLVDLRDIPVDLADGLRALGYVDVWHVAVQAPLSESNLRILAGSKKHHVPATGLTTRLAHASELAAAVMLRTHSDAVLDYAAGKDPLTALANRAQFYRSAGRLDSNRAHAVLHLDLDGVKRINTAQGQGAGDAVLQIMADRIKALCRDDDLLGRIGDDEFTIITAGEENGSLEEQALLLASHIQTAASEPIIVAGRALKLSASIGVATGESATGIDHLLTWADAAMRTSKQAGGSRITRHAC